MKKARAGFLAFALCLAVHGQAQVKTLTILHANDTHSALFPFGRPASSGPAEGSTSGSGQGLEVRVPPSRESGGLARMAALIKALRSKSGNVLALHAGDAFVGSFEFNKYLGYPELKLMEPVYDAMALGNHEFDQGVDALAAVVSGRLAGGTPVTLPLLCANVDFAGTPLSALVRKSLIKTVGGVKVGVFGVVNEDPQNYPGEVAARFSGNIYARARNQAAILRRAGCGVVICLSHLGAKADLAGLADNVPGIDIIVGGHSHDLFKDAVVRGGKVIVQAGSHGRYLGELVVRYEPGRGVRLVRWVAHPVDSGIEPDAGVQTHLNKLLQGIVEDPRFGPVHSSVVAYVGRDIEKDWPAAGANRDSALGNLVTDAMRKAAAAAGHHVDCALDALGFVAHGLAAGEAVGNDILRAVPYGYDPESGLGFKLVRVPMPGRLILAGLEYSTANVESTKDLCIQASGLTYAYDSSRPPARGLGALSRLDPMSVLINGESVAANPNKVYDVVMTDRVFAFLKSLMASTGIPLAAVDTGIFEYNAVRDYMKSLRFVNYVSEGRVKDTAATSGK